MRKLARLRRWLRGLFDLNAHMTAVNHLMRAGIIAISLTGFVLSLWGGSFLWLLVFGMATAVSTANGLWPFSQALDIVDIGEELGIVYIAFLALIAPGLLVLCSPFVLIWMLARAYRLATRPA